MPDQIHGLPVLKRLAFLGRDATLVLVKTGGYQPFVTAWHKPGADEWYWGHYFNTLEAAEADFIERAEEGH